MQGPMQKMGHGVMPLNGIAPVGIDRHAHRFARFGRAPLGKNRAVNKDIPAFLRVLDPKLTDFRAVVPGNVQQAMIAHLSAHLGVTRGPIEHDIDFFRSLSRQNRLHDRLRLQKVMTEKPGRGDLEVAVLDADRLLFLRGTAAARCSSINFSKPAVSTESPRSRAISSVRSSGKPCSS